MGANRLYVLGGDWRKEYKNKEENIRGSCVRSFVGMYTKLEEDEKPMTTSYNPIVTSELNKRFSVLYNVDKLPKTIPIQLIHAEDDKMVSFSLSLALHETLRNSEHKISGYFISQGDHGFIKNFDCMSPDESKRLEKAAKSILKFFGEEEIRENSIAFDDTSIKDLQAIPLERDALKEHEEFLRHYSQ